MTIDQPPVTDAEGARTGNGHRYFRKSPWASSDILMMLMYGLTPEQRGLQLKSNMPVYEFPPDHIARLRSAVAEADPAFGADYRTRKPEATGHNR